MSTQTKKLSESTVVQSIAEADKIPIVNSSGQTVLVPLSGLLGAVKVGGRNLVKGSDRTSGSTSGASYDYGWKSLTELPADGEEVTLSFECSSDITGIMTRLVNVGDIRLSGNTKQVSNGRYYITGKWANPVTLNGCSMYVYAAGLSIRRIKVERGNIPTDWSPAPEDWGGVKTSLSAVCAFTAQLSAWEGGLQHEPNEGLDEHGAQGHHDGRSRVPRIQSGPQHNNPWYISDKRPKDSRQIIRIWDSAGDGSGHFRVTGISASSVRNCLTQRRLGERPNWRFRQKGMVQRHMGAVGYPQGRIGNIDRKEVAV